MDLPTHDQPGAEAQHRPLHDQPQEADSRGEIGVAIRADRLPFHHRVAIDLPAARERIVHRHRVDRIGVAGDAVRELIAALPGLMRDL